MRNENSTQRAGDAKNIAKRHVKENNDSSVLGFSKLIKQNYQGNLRKLKTNL